MLMFYYSANHEEVEQIRKELTQAGIPCEVREIASCEGKAHWSGEEELWIQNDQDSHRAQMLCVANGLGFAKRTPPPDCFG